MSAETFVILAHRWGYLNDHYYIAGTASNLDAGKIIADNEQGRRGGKIDEATGRADADKRAFLKFVWNSFLSESLSPHELRSTDRTDAGGKADYRLYFQSLRACWNEPLKTNMLPITGKRERREI